MSSARHLAVSANGQTIGTLIEQDDIWALEYAKSWQQAAGAFPLSPALPLAQKLHRDGSSRRTVQWYFDNLLPEELLREVISREQSVSASEREVARMIEHLPTAADALLADMAREMADAVASSAQPETIRATQGAEAYLLRGVRNMVITDMLRRAA